MTINNMDEAQERIEALRTALTYKISNLSVIYREDLNKIRNEMIEHLTSIQNIKQMMFEEIDKIKRDTDKKYNMQRVHTVLCCILLITIWAFVELVR